MAGGTGACVEVELRPKARRTRSKTDGVEEKVIDLPKTSSSGSAKAFLWHGLLAREVR